MRLRSPAKPLARLARSLCTALTALAAVTSLAADGGTPGTAAPAGKPSEAQAATAGEALVAVTPQDGATLASPNETPPVEVSLRSPDNHSFKGLYLAPPSSASNGILIVPDIGQTRSHFLRLAQTLRGRGYRVFSIDNTGQLRNVGRGPGGRPTFTPMSTSSLKFVVKDVATGVASLRSQPGVDRVAILGFGIGANAALLAAGQDEKIGAVGASVPSYGCEDFDPYAAFGDMNARPMILVESRKKYQSDLSYALERIMAKRKDLPYAHVQLRRDPEALTPQDLEEDYEDALLVWLDKVFPTAAR